MTSLLAVQLMAFESQCVLIFVTLELLVSALSIDNTSCCLSSEKSLSSSTSISRLTFLSSVAAARVLNFARSICDLKTMLTGIISSLFWFKTSCNLESIAFCANPILHNKMRVNVNSNFFIILKVNRLQTTDNRLFVELKTES